MTAPAGAPVIAVVDYGIGNLHSAQKALARVGADALLTDDPDLIGSADAVVLPGVGAFGACMDALRARRLEPAVLDAAASDRPFLGICVGMQMLFTASDESPGWRGLGIIPGSIREIPGTVKKPQMQWNVLQPVVAGEPLFAGLGPEPWFYFVHSWHGVPDDPSVVTATCDYGSPINAAFRRGNVAAVQFHPEKSATSGLALLGNFVAGVAASSSAAAAKA